MMSCDQYGQNPQKGKSGHAGPTTLKTGAVDVVVELCLITPSGNIILIWSA